MRYIRQTDWPEVKEQWQLGEEECWREFYAAKGFKNWEDWRWARIQLLGLEKREWTLEEPDNVVEEVRQMLCDASTRWTDFYKRREDSTFVTLKDHPSLRNHKRILSIREKFPNNSWMIGLRNRGRIIVADGHHRATAIAGMDDNYPKPPVQFAMSDISDLEFNKFYEGGLILKAERRVWDMINLVRCNIGKYTHKNFSL